MDDSALAAPATGQVQKAIRAQIGSSYAGRTHSRRHPVPLGNCTVIKQVNCIMYSSCLLALVHRPLILLTNIFRAPCSRPGLAAGVAIYSLQLQCTLAELSEFKNICSTGHASDYNSVIRQVNKCKVAI